MRSSGFTRVLFESSGCTGVIRPAAVEDSFIGDCFRVIGVAEDSNDAVACVVDAVAAEEDAIKRSGASGIDIAVAVVVNGVPDPEDACVDPV